jgi:tetratricopeptide (TPR) repeat protein
MEDVDDLLEAALECMEEEDYARSLKLWGKAYDAMHAEDPQQNLDKAEVCLNQAICLSRLGKHAQAVELAETIVDYYQWTVQHASEEGQRALFILTEAATLGEEWDKALGASDAAIKALREDECDDPVLIASTVQKRCWIAELQKNPELCESAVDWALAQFAAMQEGKLRKDVRQQVTFQAAQVLESSGRVQLAAGRRAEAQKALHEAIASYDKAFGQGDETGDDARELLKTLA